MDSSTPRSVSTNYTLIAVSIVFFSLSILCVSLRFYVRRFTQTWLGWDDWCIFAGLNVGLISTAVLIWADSIDNGGPPTTDKVDSSYNFTGQDQTFLQVSFLTSVIYLTTSSLIRLGTLITYNRIFSVQDDFRFQVAGLLLLVIANWAVCTVVSLASCMPLQYMWVDEKADPSYCFDFNHFWVVAGIIEVLLDALILGLPIYAILSLEVGIRRRIRFLVMFIPSLLIIVTGILRTVLSFSPTQRLPVYSRSQIWITVHTGTALICACVPIFKPLFTRLMEHQFIKDTALRFSMIPPTNEHHHDRPDPNDGGDRGRWARVKHSLNDSKSSVGSGVSLVAATPMSEKSLSPAPSPDPTGTRRQRESSMNRDPRFWQAAGLGIGVGAGVGRDATIVTLKDSPGCQARWSRAVHRYSDSGVLQAATVSRLDFGLDGCDIEEVGGRLLSPPAPATGGAPPMSRKQSESGTVHGATASRLDFGAFAYNDADVQKRLPPPPASVVGGTPPPSRKQSHWELDPAVFTLQQLRRPSADTEIASLAPSVEEAEWV